MPTRWHRIAALVAAAAAGLLALPRVADAGRPEPASARAAAGSYGPREDIRAFAAEVAERRGLDRDWIVRQLARANRIPAVQRLVMPPPEGTAKDWAAYRERFVEPIRVAAGTAFWQANAAWLERAEQRWGVPPEIVVGIIGVETFYGRVSGRFRVIDALATLSFDFPGGRSDRSPFFRAELEEFLVLCRRVRADPQRQRGSYAGAIGLAQFMPGSINRYAVDFDGDGRIDLAASSADAIGSVARYLAENGWRRGQPTRFEVTPPAAGDDRAALLAADILPTFSAAQFAEHGALLDGAGRDHDGPLALVELQNGQQPPSYVAGTQNFYALTRYNASSYYAMAVIALGDAVRRTR